jgi:hypothetical protein
MNTVEPPHRQCFSASRSLPRTRLSRPESPDRLPADYSARFTDTFAYQTVAYSARRTAAQPSESWRGLAGHLRASPHHLSAATSISWQGSRPPERRQERSAETVATNGRISRHCQLKAIQDASAGVQQYVAGAGRRKVAGAGRRKVAGAGRRKVAGAGRRKMAASWPWARRYGGTITCRWTSSTPSAGEELRGDLPCRQASATTILPRAGQRVFGLGV